MGDVVFGVLDGHSRLTSMAYSWMGSIPEISVKDLQHPEKRVIREAPNYSLLTSPVVVNFVMSRKRHATKSTGMSITTSTLKLCEKYSKEMQRSYALGLALSVQSLVLDLLKKYQSENPYKTLSIAMTSTPLDADAMENSEKEANDAFLKDINNELEKLQQKDIISTWHVGFAADKEEKMRILRSVKIEKMLGKRMLIDMVVRTLMLVSVYLVKDTSEGTFADEFIDLLKSFVENNGETCRPQGERFRKRSGGYITSPLMDEKIVQDSYMENSKKKRSLSEKLMKPEVLAQLQLPDPNENPALMVSCSFLGITWNVVSTNQNSMPTLYFVVPLNL